jgi:hypothetical protein
MQKDVTQSVISAEEFQGLVHPLIGLPVSRVWRGAGSAIFLEIGKLFKETWRYPKKKRKTTSIVGQFGVMIEWTWRVERPKSILFGSWSTDRMIDNRLPKLRGHTVTSIEIKGRLPELVIQLSGGFWVHSFATAEGQPTWCVFLDNVHSPSSYLVSEYGKLIHETPASARPGFSVFTPLRAALA